MENNLAQYINIDADRVIKLLACYSIVTYHEEEFASS